MSTPKKHHPFVQLAHDTIEAYVMSGKRIKPPADLSPEMREPAGAFVSLHTLNGDLRGCIGTIEPVHKTLAEEIIENAISAATRDPRFPPVRANELAQLAISVDVLTPPQAIDSIHGQDPKIHGLIVQSLRNRWKRGLLLPDLDDIDTAENQLYYTRVHKADIIDSNEPVQLYRFTVKRYH